METSDNEQKLRAALIAAERSVNSMPRTIEDLDRYVRQRDANLKAEAKARKALEQAAAEKKAADEARYREQVRAWWLATKGNELTDGVWARNEAAIIAEYERAALEAATKAKRASGIYSSF